ncbi:Prenyltransferase and squalene oxidase repeat-containing protein [Paenibacillus sp. 1_12]|uniref:S-layer homology domain-containing protein n=1 Tax=Paenibacillus sp. 1_12 TaxID=1566278 RepID=UPI0008E5EF5B|nr:S-layer homology domain-containing protein [Paenibacillus sp. 1_12]SFK95430.1 Prenyltransferase and squalene oxidase repeat-containing protein [Paenibacillus sp. 1_12]
MGSKFRRTQVSLWLVIIMFVAQAVGIISPVLGNTSQPSTITISEAIEDAGSYLLNLDTLSDWDAYALGKAGKPVPASYLNAVTAQVIKENGQFTLVTDYARMVLGVKGANGDPNAVGGHDLIEKIYNHERLTSQGNNGVIYALWALDSGKNYKVPASVKWTKSSLVQEIVSKQNTDGSWCCSAGSNDGGVDMTAAALTALAPYKAQPEVQGAVSKAIQWLQLKQLSNGGYSDGGENAESTAQVIIALSALGIDAKSDGFRKSGSDPLTYLFTYRQKDGGYAHLQSMTSTSMPTNQALQAMAAYHAINPDGGTYPGERRTNSGNSGEAAKSLVTVHVEGPTGTVIHGQEYGVTAYDAIDQLLAKSGIQRDIPEGSYGRSLKEINGVKAGVNGNDWMYNVKRQGAWDYPQTGISGYKLKTGDEVWVYYGAFDVSKLVDSVNPVPAQPKENESFQLLVKTTGLFEPNVSVASSVYVEIGAQKRTTDNSGLASFQGLPAGIHTVTVTGNTYESKPALIRAQTSLLIGDAPKVSIQVEGMHKPVTSGTAVVTNALDALLTLLTEKQIEYQVLDNPSFGKYVKSIAGEADSWNYAVWRNGGWIFPAVGMPNFQLKANDKLVVYIGGWDPPTYLVQSVSVMPQIPQANQSFAVFVEKAANDWATGNPVISPASGVQVEANGMVATTNEYGVAFFSAGLNAGTYTFTVTGYIPDVPPKIVRTTKVATIGSGPHVSITVEGSQEHVTDGVVNIQTDKTVLGALQKVLDSQPIHYTINSSSYGNYVKTIKNDSDSWSFMVWRGGAWVYPQVGMDTFQLQGDDHVVIYSGGVDASYNPTTFIVDSIIVSPEQPASGEGFSVAVKTAYWDWQANSTVVKPASAVKVSAAGQEMMTNQDGIASFSGMNSGAYVLTVTGYGEGIAPKIVRTTKLLNVLPQVTGGGGGVPVTPSVKISVTGDESRGDILSLQNVNFQMNDTPYSVLVRALGADRVEGKGQGEGIYVSGIDGLREFDKGPQSGWMYAVNCSYPSTSASSYKLKQGDKVDWRYTLNNGNDVKASGTIVCSSGLGNGTVNTQGEVILPQAVQEGISQLSIGYSNRKPADPKVRTVTVLNPENQMDWTAAMRLRDELAKNEVAIDKEVASERAVLSDSKEEITLQIPKQALTEQTMITIRKLDASNRKEVSSSLFEFTPNGTKFNKPVYISIKVPLDINDLESLAMVWLNEETNEWIPIPAAVDGATGIVTGAVDHFTKFAVIDKSKLPSVITSVPDVRAVIEAAAKHILNHSDLSDWEAYALAEAGKAVPASYLAQTEMLLKEKNGQLRNVTDYERMALGVKAAGGNPRSIAGVDLIEKIYNNDRMTVQGTNGPIFALMVLQQNGHMAPTGSKWNEASLVQWLLEQQNSNGSWSLEKGDTTNVDLTGMALVSLSPMKDRADIKAAVDKAIDWLSKQQAKSGGFELSGQENSESAAWVLMALSHLGIGPNDPRFIKADGNVLANLLSYQQSDGGFAHIHGESSTSIPTEQALLALSAYDRLSTHSESVPPQIVTSSGFADDAQISGWALEYVKKAREYGLMEGVENNRFAPADQLTRAQFVTTLLRLLGEAPDANTKLSFTDVLSEQWYYGYVAKAVEKGIVNGVTADTFAPDRSISRQEMAIVMTRAFGLKATSSEGAVYTDMNQAYELAVPSILAVQEHGYMEGDDQGRFAPAAPVTREMTAAVVVRAYEKTKNQSR